MTALEEKLFILMVQISCPIGANLPASFFNGTPQQHAIMNRHLIDYFSSRTRSQHTTPYDIPASQRHLLAPLGMEQPQPDAPTVPHGLHKSIEEGQLRRLGRLLSPNNYGIISVKTSKLSLLPPAASVQNPVFEAKDVTRYPGTAVQHAHFRDHNLYLMHDVSSEVYPHELVEKLVAENGEAQLIVTGMNPPEVLDGATTWEPSSHHIEYDLGGFNYIFTDSESEAYFTPIAVTQSWHRTSSICASNGRVYHVTLIEQKLGHCVWHIYCGEAADQHTRTFSTGSMVRLPPSITGTLREEYLPVKLLSGILDFTRRTPDLSTRNLAAKVTQVANAVNPRTTARERWIATHIAENMAPHRDFWFYLKRAFWNVLYATSFQWQMFGQAPDVYNYIDERKRTRVIHPTPGGGWTPSVSRKIIRAAIPNNPTWLHRLSALTGSVFTFMLPKIFIGEFLTHVFMNLDALRHLRTVWHWLDVSWLRILLTGSIVVVTAILPGHIVKVFSRLAGHFWRQLWLPGWVSQMFEIAVTEFTGAPGYRFFPTLPGRGFLWQFYIWTVALLSVLPAMSFNWLPYLFVDHWFVPWIAFLHPGPALFLGSLYALIVLENFLGSITKLPFNPVPASDWSGYSWYLFTCASNFLVSLVSLGFQRNLGNCQRIGNLPPLPLKPLPTVRRRNVDIVLPQVVVLPANIPNAPAGVALAIDPVGMTFPEWLRAVEQAYQANPTQYPALTPGQACFWECVASYGGTPHMWYSWYMAMMALTPNPNAAVVGRVTQPQIQVFCGISHFGLNMQGMTPTVIQPQGAGWPTISITLSRSRVHGLLHVELTSNVPVDTPVSNLARIIKTIMNMYPAWDRAIQNAFNNAAPTCVPRPHPILVGFAGDKELPTTMIQIADAIVASRTALPIDPAQQEGFALDLTIPYQAPWSTLFDYGPPAGVQEIAATPPARMWQRFRQISKHFRIPQWYPHPMVNPEMKIGATQSQIVDNRARNNERPNPARHVQLREELARQLTDYQNLALPAVPLQEEVIQFTADVGRAARLAADLRAHPSVLESRADYTTIQSLDSVIDTYRLEGKTVTMPIRCYLGVWGSGKTTATIAYLKGLTSEERMQVRIVSHTENLRAQAKMKVDFPELRGFNFPTIGSVLTEPSSGPIIFDDAGKYWGGVLDLVMLTNPMVPEIVINGDPCQGLSKFPIRGTQSEHDPSAIECVAEVATMYATITHRGFRLLADTLGVHTTNGNVGHITHTVGPKIGIPVCTASPRYVGVLAGAGRHAYTYESVQGEDFAEDMEVDMTGLEGAVSDRTAYVALTRSKTGVYVHMDAADPNSVIKSPPSGSDLMNALVYAMRRSNGPTLPAADWVIKAAFYRHIHWCMPLNPWFAQIGATLPASVFQSVLPVSEEHFVEEGVVNDPGHIKHNVGSTGPLEVYIPEVNSVAKEYRELNTSRGQTDQFKETAFINPHVHKRSDTPTYFESVAKRLTPASKDDNIRRMRACPRLELIEEYDRLVPVPPKWDADSFDGYIDRAVLEYCSKRTEHAILSKLSSHDPDRSGGDIVISLKNQVIKKKEKMLKVEAIPGQLIHEYDISVTLLDSSFALWFEDNILTAFPDNFLFYRRMNPDQFKSEYKKRWRVNNGVHTSDVTRWDVGCDAGLLNLDIHMFMSSGFPVEYVAGYVERRLNSRSQHGPMATMQNSGDRYTWPLNSARRAVVASWVLSIQPEDTCAINGDDEATDRICDSRVLPDTPWVFKDENGWRGEFSGFELGGPEPTYSAAGIHWRAQILESRDPSAQDKWVNYLDLLGHTEADSPFAVATAHMAHTYMRPELFRQFLPDKFHTLFPTVFA